MNLHEDKQQFVTILTFAAQRLQIPAAYIEKDYWITKILQKLSQSEQADSLVFKGGTSLSKGFRLINRFSEDVDIALLNPPTTDHALKKKIRSVEKEITADLTEIEEEGATRKGSAYRKALFVYPENINEFSGINKRIIVEINSFANPYPFTKQEITSFAADFLVATNRQDLIEQYGLQPFFLNILDKRRTMLEKIVSLIRFSFAENPKVELAKKIRHFYDLYFMSFDKECADFLQSRAFNNDLQELFASDQADLFDVPKGWKTRAMQESPLLTNFSELWQDLRSLYQTELSLLAFADIPNEKLAAEAFLRITDKIKKAI